MATLELLTSDSRLSHPQPLRCSHLLLLRQEPRIHRALGQEETHHAEQKRHTPRQKVDILPSLQPTTGDLGEAVVQRATDDGPPSRRAEPPALPQGLFLLRVGAGDDGHEGGGDDALQETEEEALGEQAAPACHGGGEHAHAAPEDDQHAQHNPRSLEPLQEEGERVEACQHAKVEKRGGPGETRGVHHAGRGDGGQVQVGRHAEEGGASEDGFVVVHQPIADSHGRDEEPVYLADGAPGNGWVGGMVMRADKDHGDVLVCIRRGVVGRGPSFLAHGL